MALDPVTREVIRGAAVYTAEEMGIVLRDAALSPNIRDRMDHSCAVLDPEGRLVAQAEHIPVHLGSMAVAARSLIDWLEGEGETLEEGDVLLTNNPYLSGTHLNDLMVLAPVYHGGRLVAYVANKAHHVDIGGPVPGGFNPEARSLHEEGLVIPPVKIVRRGRLDRNLLRMLESNVRTPRMLRGDLHAQLAALKVGEARVRELASRYGVPTLLEAWGEIIGYVERYTRARLRELAAGAQAREAEAVDTLESRTGRLLEIKAAVRLHGDTVEVDFTGTSGQVEEPLNAVYGVTVAAATYALKTVADPDMPMNHGFYNAVHITAPRGSLVNPEPPAPVAGGNVETSQRIVDAVHRALAALLPGRVPAASCGTMSNLALGGRGWTFYETIACGAGARPCCDGVDAVQTNMTNTMNTPIEVAENTYPLLFRRYEIRPATGGPGRWRGGHGLVREVTVLEPATLTVYGDRVKTRPWGLEGGAPGEPARYTVKRWDGRVETLPSKATLHLEPGDTVAIETPGGGGYGDPCTRPRELIERDIEEEKETLETARRRYCQ